MDTISVKDAALCRHPNCHYLTPGPSLAQRGVLRLGLKGLDLILNAVKQPAHVERMVVNLSRKLSGLKIRHQKAGGAVWPYLEGGAGEHVILLHGFGADKDRFGVLGPLLRRLFHVVIPDLPGFGEHLPDWSADYGIDAQVRRFNQFIDAAGFRDFHLVGISLGGYLAGCYAARHPQRVKSLFLMDSAGFSAPVGSDAMRLFQTRNRIVFLPGSGQEMQEMVDYLMHCPVRLPSTLKRYWMQQISDQLPWRRKIVNDLLGNGMELLDGLAGSITAPTLVVWGAEDRICHVSTVANILDMIDQCQAYIIQGCGHIPMVEFPALVRNIYVDFLQKAGEA